MGNIKENIMKIAFLFPGQGAQYIGMGKELYDNYQIVKETFDFADEVLQEKLSELIFTGSQEDLVKTQNTQPAVLTFSTAVAWLLESLGIKPCMVAGLSLGEYSALTYSRAILFKDSLPLVRKRGYFMDQAVPAGRGSMAAIVGLDEENLLPCLKDAENIGHVQIANYNCPGQLVISGQTEAVLKACELAKTAGAKRAIPLKVSGPFHSTLLKEAGTKLAKELEKIDILTPQLELVSNVTAELVDTPIQIKDLLIKQVSHPVRWEDSIRLMLEKGINTFIELGPGKALSGFMRRIDKSVNVYNVEDINTLESTLEKLEAII
jgi:[acyl-carrier-protein] S-malonyltransferase